MKCLRSWPAVLGAGIMLAVGPVSAEDSRVPLPTLTRGKGERCVEPVPIIRRDHMRFLLHQRDETVHRGIRTKKYSLKECIDCHVNTDEQGRTIPVNAPEQFCESCHSYAAVTLDCFQCHATTPDSGSDKTQAKRGAEDHARGLDHLHIGGEIGKRGDSAVLASRPLSPPTGEGK